MPRGGGRNANDEEAACSSGSWTNNHAERGKRMTESRRQNREIINYYMQVIDRQDDALLGYLLDVNEHGLLLQSHGGLPRRGESHDLRLLLRDPLEGHGHLDVKARLVWSRKQPASVFHHSGFELRNLDDETSKVIRALMARFALGEKDADTTG